MATKHWHLTTDPDAQSDRGGPIAQKQAAERLADGVRRHLIADRPVYVVCCTEPHTR